MEMEEIVCACENYQSFCLHRKTALAQTMLGLIIRQHR